MAAWFEDDIDDNKINSLALPSTVSTVSIDSVLSKLIDEYEQINAQGHGMDIPHSELLATVKRANVNHNVSKVGSYMDSRGYTKIKKSRNFYWTKVTT